MNATPVPARRSGSRRWFHRLVVVALLLAGAVVSVFPVAETLWNNREGAQASAAYAQAVTASDLPALTQQLAAAQHYNATLTPQALNDPWSDAQPATSAAHAAYAKQLSLFGPLGRIRIPAIDVDLPIMKDATHAQLALGAGHMYGTSLPVGGAGTHSVIAGHTGSKRRVFFDRLTDLAKGDVFYIDVYGATLTYRVDQISVVAADDLRLIAPIKGRDLVTLVTCHVGADGVNRRLLVRGTRIPTTDAAAAGSAAAPATGPAPGVAVTPGVANSTSAGSTTQATRGSDLTAATGLDLRPAAQASATFDSSLQPWMLPRVATAAVALLLVLLMLAGWTRRDAKEGHASHPDQNGSLV